MRDAAWRSVLREIVRTLDVLLSGDHRRYGHVPPEHCEPPTAPPPKCEDSARSVRRAW